MGSSIAKKCACLLAALIAFTACAGAETDGLTPAFRAFRDAMPVTETVTERAGAHVITLENGVLRIADADGAAVWRTDEAWYVTAFDTGDVNRDGVLDVAFVLWKSYRFGKAHPARMANDDEAVGCHLYVYAVKGGKAKALWCSSTLPRGIYGMELRDDGVQTPVLSGVRLLTLEGADAESALEYEYVWNGWGFGSAD